MRISVFENPLQLVLCPSLTKSYTEGMVWESLIVRRMRESLKSAAMKKSAVSFKKNPVHSYICFFRWGGKSGGNAVSDRRERWQTVVVDGGRQKKWFVCFDNTHVCLPRKVISIFLNRTNKLLHKAKEKGRKDKEFVLEWRRSRNLTKHWKLPFIQPEA